MDQFVCVRMVQANNMDLSLFQFDYDLTIAFFFMNADKTIYGRYGSRSDNRDAERDISMESLAQAMKAALELHEGYPANKAQLAGKQPQPVKVTRPEDYAQLSHYKPKLDYGGEVVKSCMHCHQIRDAERATLRGAGKVFPDDVMYPYPMPETIGLHLDPKAIARVERVDGGSPAAASGLRIGDEIVALGGQPMLSIADIQWVLHHARAADRIPAQVRRGGREMNITLALPSGWRKQSDISWRVSTWMLRRDGFGGMKPEDMSDEQRRAHQIPTDKMALHLAHVGQYGDHAVAKRAGFVKGDIIVEFDGLTKRMTETELLEYVLPKGGQRVPVTVRRGDRQLKLTLPVPK